MRMMNTLKKQRGFIGITAAGVAATAAVASAGIGVAGALSGGGGGGGPAPGGVGSPGYAATQRSLERAGQVFKDLETPALADLRVRLKKAVFMGNLKPIQAIAMLQKASEMAKIKTDPRAEYAQYRSLEQLSRTVNQKGMTQEDKMHLFNTMEEQQVDVQGARGRYAQGLQEKGQYDQTAQQIERAVSGQAAANRGAKTAMTVAADAEARKERASQEAGILASAIREQKFAEDAEKAGAEDDINEYNAMVKNKFEQDRVANLRDVRDRNRAEKQRIAELNVETKNKERVANVNARQQDYLNRRRKARGRASAYGASADVASSAPIQQRKKKGNVLGSVLGAVGTIAGAFV